MDKKTAASGGSGLVLIFVDWALKMIDFKSEPLGHTLAVLGLLCLAYALFHWCTVTPRVALYWRWDWPWWGLVPLPAAAELAFERLRGTDYEREALRRATAEERLDHMATYLAFESRAIYGRRAPGQLRVLPSLMVHAGGQIEGGGTRLRPYGNPDPYAEDLHIHRGDLWAALSRISDDARDV